MSFCHKRKRFKYYISLLLVSIILWNSIGKISVVFGSSKDKWVIINGPTNGSTNGTQNTEIKGDIIVQTGKHNSADDNAIRYRTLYFRMAKKMYNTGNEFTDGNNADIYYVKVPFTFGFEDDDGTTKTTQYIIKRRDFITAASSEEIGYTGDYIYQHGSAVVYLNNVFQVFQGDNILDKFVWGYQEMLSEAPWSERTRNFLLGYYNFQYTLTSDNLFKVKVIAVDENDNVLDNDLLGYTKHAICGETIPPYTLENDTIKVGDKSYKYQYWKYTYTDCDSEEVKKLGNYTSKEVSFTAPDAYPDSTLTVKMVFKSSGPTITPPPGTSTPTPKVTATPTPKPSATPTPYITPFLTPSPAPAISLERDTPDPKGVINADKYGSPYFDSKKGISTTESQYVYVKTKDYLLGYKLVNRTGKVKYTVPVKVQYTLNYFSATPDKYGGKKPVIDTVSNTWNYSVERAYSYWEVTNLEYYTVNSANVYNYSLPDGGVTLSLNNSYVKCPSLSTNHSYRLEDHVLPPKEVFDGITINKTLSSTDCNRPIIEREDFSYFALTQTGEATVRNDYIMFDDKVVLSNVPYEKLAPKPDVSGFVQSTTIIPDKALYTEGKVVDAKKYNGEYKSTGTVHYTMHPASVNAVVPENSYVLDVNDVTIHTPVVCVPVVTADNDKWLQLINPTKDTVQIVLDPDNTLNDFTLFISNTLQHSNRLGYLTRDFSRSFIDPEFTSYLAREDGIVRNEVKLPFDVYQDTYNDKNKINDKYIKAGTWIVLGRNTYRFYVPLWVQEGVYTADFRSIAVNGDDKLDSTEYRRNSELRHYVATNTVNFEISGRIYGLKLYDISDYPKWKNVFRKENTMLFKYFEGAVDGTKQAMYNKDYGYYYAVGTKDQYGKDTGRYSKFTVPLVNGDHPQYKNLGVLKTGYAVRFLLDTVGEMYGGLSQIKIMPTFYYVDSDGRNRRRVDLYYNETIKNDRYSLVKVGAGVDLVNLKMGPMNNIYSRIPQSEIANTAKVLNTTYAKVADKIAPMYAYSTFRLPSEFRTYTGTEYATGVAALESFAAVKAATGLTSTTVSKYMQRWYGTYKLPEDIHIVEAGYDVYDHLKKYGIDYKENFWLKDGYLIVNFNIITIDARGKEHLSYINANNYLNNGNCSMPITEGAVLQKTDNQGTVFNLKAGDFVIYYSDKSYDDDYEGVLY